MRGELLKFRFKLSIVKWTTTHEYPGEYAAGLDVPLGVGGGEAQEARQQGRRHHHRAQARRPVQGLHTRGATVHKNIDR